MEMVLTGLSPVIEPFPEHRKALARLNQQNETSRSRCEGLFESARARDYWCGSKAGNAVSLCEEYTTMVGDLKAEIAEWLADDGATS
jgi:hypothetical protein